MKRRLMRTLLGLGIAVVGMLAVSDQKADAQKNKLFIYDSGIVAPGPDQMLIGLLVPAVQDGGPTDNATVRSRKVQYSQTSCTAGPCKHIVTSDTISEPVSLAIGEGMSDVMAVTGGSSGIRLVFVSNSPNLRFNGQLVDTTTGAVVSTFSWGTCNGC